MMPRVRVLTVTMALAWCVATATQQAAASQGDLRSAIDQLGSFEFGVRMEAARTVRRTAAEAAVPALADAARSHKDEYVRYRALTLLAGFGGPVAAQVMNELKGDRNDRLRMVAFAWFEHNADPAVLPALVAAFGVERSEFVRPSLTRALAAQGNDPRARAVLAPLVLRGDDYFRGAVIEALGEYEGRFALADIVKVAEQDGPLQDDAITAVGRLGDASHLPLLGRLQRSVPEHLQPTIAAALCALGRACAETEAYLKETLAFASRSAGYQSLLRGAVHGLAVLTLRGSDAAWQALLAAGAAAEAEQVRAPLMLGVGLVALRQPEKILVGLERLPSLDRAIDLVRDAFDQLAEDYEEERFYVSVRRAYWAAPEGSARRRVAEALIQHLEF
jgi:HEAT repeat protein